MKGPHQNVEFRLYAVQTSVNYSRLRRTLSSWISSVSKAEDSITALRYLFQCLTTLTVKKFFVYLSGISYISICVCYHWAAVKR